MALDNIRDISLQFKSSKELQEYCDAQYATLQVAQERIRSLEMEVAHLQHLLTSTTSLVDTKKFVVSDEQAICEMQIKRLKEQSLDRELEMEEAKKLDLYVKNLYLIKEKSPTIKADATTVLENEAELIAAASLPDPSPVYE